MESAYLLIPLSLVLLGGAVWAFFWAVDHEQFDELEQQGDKILDDD
jgi:cbb3-type cytochrome oxidase maturation protein